MKKITAVLMALVIVLAFAGCSNKNGGDELTVDEIPSDVISEQATNESGEPVTEADTSANNEGTATTAEKEKTTASKNTQSDNKTTKKPTTTKPTTTKPTTTTKRKISFTVEYPYYNAMKTTVLIEYKEQGDKKYKELVKDEEITLDRRQKVTYEIDENLIGDVDVRVTINGVVLLENDFVISGTESQKFISLAAGTEMHDGGLI